MILNRNIFWLFLIWMIVTAFNLYKPFQIDDAAHLMISAWIMNHPLHPMSGPINWSGTVQPIYDTNQPHLYFYALALWERLFGFSEVALHSLQSLFSAACIALFYFIARRLAEGQALWLTAMMVLNPAFVVSQNIMVDIPLLACWLGFFACLLRGIDSPHQNRRFALAALACSAALLIKYSSLVLIPMLLFPLILERRPCQAWCVLIPILVLAAWSAFNVFDYGGIHLATGFHSAAKSYLPPLVHHTHFKILYRILTPSVIKLGKYAISWIVGIGALSFFGAIALALDFPRIANLIYITCLGGLIVLAASVGLGILHDRIADLLLFLGFLGNGVLAVLFVLRPRRDLALVYLQMWIVLTSIFYVFTAPFIAARHVLLILPAIALLVAATHEIPRNAKVFGLIITAILTVGLGVSDFRFASFYKAEASTIKSTFPQGAKIWAAGHFGWQYYASKNGIPEIDAGAGLFDAALQCQEKTGVDPEAVATLEQDPATRLPKSCGNLNVPFPNASSLHAGDYVAVPTGFTYQLPTYITITPFRTDKYNASAADPFCTGRDWRFYSFTGLWGPWSLSGNCSQHVDIFQVKSPG